VLLGKNPYTPGDDSPVTRPDHQPGYILSNVVVGTVRLRQQRVRLQCNPDNVLGLPQRDMLCYRPGLEGNEATDDWAWPRFLATAGTPPRAHNACAPCMWVCVCEGERACRQRHGAGTDRGCAGGEWR
jgi:hypothetical protein